ncbi:D-TA family PLP-dependent enzyme [Pedobacter petrophilus]|uniref:D-TA family PLP-dependent enzyme n=1 Tax=Pedobacter petrophilus TaxID=1908241 RepID=A0A7K0G2E1_9SPHI|nr:D-TA family PLP-dependent enzyme [Pedobacter petrophilus]MRX77821.1 D-TA family PLP-dependent enzyme [Pedobacter petrophilus]
MIETGGYCIKNSALTDTPFLAVYPDIVTENIARLVALFSDISQIRPHVKTHKCLQVVNLMLEAGIQKFKCATIGEAEMLAQAGSRDILLAYQPVGPKIQRFVDLIIKYPLSKFSCLVDNESSAQELSDTACRANIVIAIWVDLNVGMNRTGVKPQSEGKALFMFCVSLPSIRILGLHAYDGHITDYQVSVRHSQATSSFEQVRKLTDELSQMGFKQLRITAGSTPTINFYSQFKDVECSPGTFIYWDRHYQALYPELGFKTAALIVTRVISKPATDTVCLDLGYKAISSEGAPDERVNFLQFPEAVIFSQSEEHLLVKVPGSEINIGDTLLGMPHHIGRTCNLYDSSTFVVENRIMGSWKNTGRKR